MNQKAIVVGAVIFIFGGALVFVLSTEKEHRESSAPLTVETIQNPEPPAEKQSPGQLRPDTNVDASSTQVTKIARQVELSIEDLVPLEMYERYADLASDGDLNAATVLLELMDKCRGANSKDYVSRVMQSRLSQDRKDALVRRYERCSPLTDVVGNTEVEYERLLELLLDARHPLIMVRQRNLNAQEKRDRLINAILADYPEPFLYEKAFLEAGVYHRKYPEHLNQYRQEAWFLLHCEARLECDYQEYRAKLKTEDYLEHDFAEIEKMEESLRAAIASKDPLALGF